MPTYISLVNWTDQGIRNVKESPNRLRESEPQLQQFGVRLVAFYLTMGDHDIVTILEAPDDEAAARALLGLGMQGNVRTKTLKAFSRDEYERIIGSLP